MWGWSLYCLYWERNLCVFVHTFRTCTHNSALIEEELGYSTRQLSANADISFLSPIRYQKKIFALCACNTLRRWKPGCFSLYWRCLGRYHSYRSSWSSGTVENTTCQSRSGMTKFPNPLSHRSQPSHDPKPWQCITYRPLSMKRDALEQSLGPNNSFSGSSVACLQNGFGLNVPWVPGQPQSGVVSAVYDCTCVRYPSQGSARPAAPTSAPDHHP